MKSAGTRVRQKTKRAVPKKAAAGSRFDEKYPNLTTANLEALRHRFDAEGWDREGEAALPKKAGRS
ncbi:MAG: hypothetical protein JWN24_4774 [Phycisphaerales bacterium]|nr:hypothetical protein [Phycisphaerales bacterium]